MHAHCFLEEKILIMVDKKLHKSYTKNIKSLQTIDLKGNFSNVTIEWE